MSESKHTPGPWVAIRREVRIGNRRICSNVNAGESLGLLQDNERACKNALLIAAAPDLLDALKNAVGVLDAFSTQSQTAELIAKEARAAISKATGEKQ